MWGAPRDWGGRDVTAGIPEFEGEQASTSGVSTTDTRATAVDSRASTEAYGGHLKSDGADSLVDTSIRRRPYDDAEMTGLQVQV
ncbi:hypothetical protein GCM10010384_12910 [Streptomyces djakartensis]|uniref:Uncharacterized protein n=1 Tax=Streptomyces djakartensis TaxID=68193 RepID=A0ABQ2ZCT7_9ACTN|nr:hypothetical protein GCM10010384_12910 [Streptomyces djakartensis]